MLSDPQQQSQSSPYQRESQTNSNNVAKASSGNDKKMTDKDSLAIEMNSRDEQHSESTSNSHKKLKKTNGVSSDAVLDPQSDYNHTIENSRDRMTGQQDNNNNNNRNTNERKEDTVESH